MRSRAVISLVLLGAVACGGTLVPADGFVPDSGPTEAGGGVTGPTPTPAADAGSAPPLAADDAGSNDAATVLDAGAAVDAAGDPAIAQCLVAPNGIYVVATGGYAGLAGASQTVGAEGTWIAPVSSVANVQINGPDGGWAFVVTAGVTSPPYTLAPGEFFGSGPGLTAGGAYAQVLADGVSCDVIPTGTFDIVDVAFDGTGTSPPLRRLLASFDLACGDAGRLVGCARYTE